MAAPPDENGSHDKTKENPTDTLSTNKSQRNQNNSNSITNEATEMTGGKEENPFSFRHFLSRSQGNPLVPQAQAQSTPQPDASRAAAEEHLAQMYGGARPKTFHRPPPVHEQEHPPQPARTQGHFDIKSPCGLPDFVQDHLVIEQEHGGIQPVNLPNGLHFNGYSEKSPLDLPRSPSPMHAEGGLPIPLDLANLATLDLANLNAASVTDNMPQFDAPADLPLVDEINNNENIHQALGQLPDFLSDGPMHTERAVPDLQEAAAFEIAQPVVESPESSSAYQELAEENERLRRELEVLRCSERTARERIAQLELRLEEQRTRENQESVTIERAIEGVERNLQQAIKRAVQAESQVSQLHQQLRLVEAENLRLEEENQRLRRRDPAVDLHRRVNRTAQDLHAAANTAERTIRELLNGVEHLRVLAASLESTERIEEIPPQTKQEP